MLSNAFEKSIAKTRTNGFVDSMVLVEEFYSVKWRVPDQELDERKPGQILCKKDCHAC